MNVPVSIHGNQRRMTHSLGLGLQVPQSHLVWVLEPDLESSVKQYIIALFKITYQIGLKLKLQVVVSQQYIGASNWTQALWKSGMFS